MYAIYKVKLTILLTSPLPTEQGRGPNPGPRNGRHGLLSLGERRTQLPRTSRRPLAPRASTTQAIRPATSRFPLRRTRRYPAIPLSHPFCIAQRHSIHNPIDIHPKQIHVRYHQRRQATSHPEPGRTRIRPSCAQNCNRRRMESDRLNEAFVNFGPAAHTCLYCICPSINKTLKTHDRSNAAIRYDSAHSMSGNAVKVQMIDPSRGGGY